MGLEDLNACTYFDSRAAFIRAYASVLGALRSTSKDMLINFDKPPSKTVIAFQGIFNHPRTFSDLSFCEWLPLRLNMKLDSERSSGYPDSKTPFDLCPSTTWLCTRSQTTMCGLVDSPHTHSGWGLLFAVVWPPVEQFCTFWFKGVVFSKGRDTAPSLLWSQILRNRSVSSGSRWLS